MYVDEYMYVWTSGCTLTVKMMRNVHKWRVFYIEWWREFETEWTVKEWLCWCESWRKLSWTQSHLPRGQTKSSFFHTYMKNTRSLEGINHYRQSVHTYFHTFHWMSALDDRVWSFNINVDMCMSIFMEVHIISLPTQWIKMTFSHLLYTRNNRTYEDQLSDTIAWIEVTK